MNIKTNSNEIKNNDTFLSINGEKYIIDAIKNGASNIIVDKIPSFINLVPNTKKYLEDYLKNNYDFDKLKIIGVTGTNGKTTTAFLISSMLTNLNIDNAYIGTIGFFINNKLIKKLNNTTPDTLTLYNLIEEAKINNCKYITMEVSSHALKQNRLNKICFDASIFTNLTEDHLDYHKTMDDYLNSKLMILDKMKKYGTVIINNDDPYSIFFKKNNYKTLGLNNSDLNILKYINTENGTIIYFNYKNKTYTINTNLHSKFNVYNYLSSILCLESLGFNIEKLIDISKNIYPPPGRFEIIDKNIIVDYAHTPDAVDKIINEVKTCFNKNVITILGCGGNREKEKRPIMGEIASSNSFYTIFTNDNPRYENELDILKDISRNLKNNNYEIIVNRKDAIKKGIELLNDDLMLLILGKGHEDYQIINNTKYYFSDKETALKCLKKVRKF